MPSPFPGMDPFIEACGLWEDFHNSLIGQISSQLAEVAPPRYVLRTGTRSYVVLADSEDKSCHPIPPHVSSTTTRGRKKGRGEGSVSITPRKWPHP
jgi:hypothetical protein